MNNKEWVEGTKVLVVPILNKLVLIDLKEQQGTGKESAHETIRLKSFAVLNFILLHAVILLWLIKTCLLVISSGHFLFLNAVITALATGSEVFSLEHQYGEYILSEAQSRWHVMCNVTHSPLP